MAICDEDIKNVQVTHNGRHKTYFDLWDKERKEIASKFERIWKDEETKRYTPTEINFKLWDNYIVDAKKCLNWIVQSTL